MAVGREVVVLSGVRTPVGTYGGGLKDFSPATLGAMVIREGVGRAGVAPDDVGHVVFGHVVPTEKHDVYLARVAAVNAGLPVKVPAVTVNRLCGSGLQAIIDAVTGGLTDPFDDYPMGVTAENVAAKWGVSREEQDALAVESHRRAARATVNGYFKEQILPVEVKTRKGTTVIDE